MATNVPDAKMIYLALRGIFYMSGLRNVKTVRKLILSGMRTDYRVQGLVQKYNIEAVCRVAMDLLHETVFDSIEVARVRFPSLSYEELFNFDIDIEGLDELEPDYHAVEATENPRVVDALRAIKNLRVVDAAQATDNIPAIDAAQATDDNLPAVDAAQATDENLPAVAPEDLEVVLSVEESSTPQHPIPKPPKAPSSPRLVFPFPQQHHLLVTIQRMLEEACFKFGQKHMPQILLHRNWDCAEAVELHIFFWILRKYQKDIADNSGIENIIAPLSRTIPSIRHTAVHRRRSSPKLMEELLKGAEQLAIFLQDEACIRSMSKIRQDISDMLKHQEKRAQALNQAFEDSIANINAKRAELDRLEQAATLEMEKGYDAFDGLMATALETMDLRKRKRDNDDTELSMLDDQDASGEDLSRDWKRLKLDSGMPHERAASVP